MKDHYTEEEAQSILSRAVERHAVTGGMTRDQLQAIAAEIGVSNEALVQAEHDCEAERGSREERLAFETHQRNEFMSHAIQMAAIAAFLFAMDLYMAHRITWSVFPILGMALSVALKGRVLLVRGGEDYEKDYMEWRAKRLASRM
ncbi:MAG TPA: 2TM domain-containing protein [Armatimonadota bacterium]|jgi:hypothetical protein